MAAKYDPLTRRLRGEPGDALELTFTELDRLVGGLPASARSSRTWWGNTVNPSHVQAAAWVGPGWVIAEVDLVAERVRFERGQVQERGSGGGNNGPDGVEQLATVLRQAGYESTLHAVAAHTRFLHPATVEQTGGQAVFATVRRDARQPGEQVGTIGTLDGQQVMFDDNSSPTSAYLWAAGHGRGRDMQFNHVWQASRNREAYTALWNLCATPAFLAKTTDGRNHPEVIRALQRRSYDLYGCLPNGATPPTAPDGYDELEWAPMPEPIADLESTYRRAMHSKPKDRVTISCRTIGWLYSKWQPDESL
ncbi:MAG TPA: hypothetical protein DCR14_17965 [Acidimicrobiaceae bacterium]|nr:hypothetical protein [Acidimicrobiaceae bacterium]